MTTTASGVLKLFFGPMFSGKSTAALREGERLECSAMRVMWITHNIDKRYSDDPRICAHNRTSHVAERLDTLASLLSRCDEFDALVIDELQFFDADDVLSSVCALLERGKHVIAAGLDANFLRKPFTQVLQLIPFASQAQKLTAVCMFCRRCDAIHTVYMGEKPIDGFLVGTSPYRAACTDCYVKHSTHKEHSRQSPPDNRVVVA